MRKDSSRWKNRGYNEFERGVDVTFLEGNIRVASRALEQIFNIPSSFRCPTVAPSDSEAADDDGEGVVRTNCAVVVLADAGISAEKANGGLELFSTLAGLLAGSGPTPCVSSDLESKGTQKASELVKHTLPTNRNRNLKLL